MSKQASHGTNMCTLSLHRFPDIPYIDPAPLPKSVPQVDELGVTSAPLKSAAFFIGAHCKPYNGELAFDMYTGVFSHAHIWPHLLPLPTYLSLQRCSIAHSDSATYQRTSCYASQRTGILNIA